MNDSSSGEEGKRKVKPNSLEMEIVDLSKDWIKVKIRNRGIRSYKHNLCIEIRKMLNEPIIVTKRILFIKKKIKVYDLTVGRYCMDNRVEPFSEKVITIHLDEPIDPEEKYSLALLKCNKGKDKNTLLIRLFDPKEFLSE